MSFPQSRSLAAAMVCLSLASVLSAQNANPPAALTSAQVVQEMQEHNLVRTDGLRHYKATRHYQVDYKGFGTGFGAKMEVEVSYDAPSAKTFRIVSQSGSGLLIDKVLKRLLETEKEAAQHQGATALTPANYTFKLDGLESVAGRPAYMLTVEPVVENKLLYRGRIWVDAADFAVVKIDAQPAKNPSFWITRTDVRHTYSKTGEFWLPQQNRSESKVRVGGTAVLTIDYGTYAIEPEGTAVAAGTR